MEQHVSEIIHWIIAFVMILMIISLGILGKQISDVNSFKQYVNASIERHGGYTDESKNDISAHAKVYYQNKFKLINVSNYGRIGFGQKVDYQIEGDFPIVFFDNASFTAYFNGVSSSKLRGV